MSQKIRIKLKSFDHNLVDKSSEKIVKTVKSTGAVVSGPVPLPTRKQIFTVNRSTFVNRKRRSRTVPALHVQTDSRYLFVDAQNDRCSDETGASFGCRGGDQSLICVVGRDRSDAKAPETASARFRTFGRNVPPAAANPTSSARRFTLY